MTGKPSAQREAEAGLWQIQSINHTIRLPASVNPHSARALYTLSCQLYIRIERSSKPGRNSQVDLQREPANAPAGVAARGGGEKEAGAVHDKVMETHTSGDAGHAGTQENAELPVAAKDGVPQGSKGQEGEGNEHVPQHVNPHVTGDA